eukprot:jgi/Tetstr1/437736/TSEL_026390.t1
MEGVNLDYGADGSGVVGWSRQVFGGGESDMGREGSPMTAAGGQPPNNGDTPPSGQRKRGCGATQPAADRACSTIRTSKSHAEWVRQFAEDNRLHQQVVVDHAVELLKKKEGSGVMRNLPATDVLVHVVRPGMSREPSNEEYSPVLVIGTLGATSHVAYLARSHKAAWRVRQGVGLVKRAVVAAGAHGES